jgi:hypothetical protein
VCLQVDADCVIYTQTFITKLFEQAMLIEQGIYTPWVRAAGDLFSDVLVISHTAYAMVVLFYVKYFCKSIDICDLLIQNILTSLRKNGRAFFVVRYEKRK